VVFADHLHRFMPSTPPVPSLTDTARTLLGDAWSAWLKLMKVLVPALLVVKLLDELGGTALLGALLAPALGLLGLPDWAGVVWAATLLTNLMTGLVLVVQFAEGGSFSVAQATVLGTLMLIGHSLPVEGAVARRAGVPWRVTLALRIGGALVLGALLHALYDGFGWLQEPVRLAWQPATGDDSLPGWALALCFLGLVHSIVEDTLLIVALGAHLSGILLARLVFSVVVIVLVSRFVPERWFVVQR